MSVGITELEWERINRARVWIGDYPDSIFSKPDCFERASIEATAALANQKRVAVVELFLPLGASAAYGMLALEYRIQNAKALSIEVASCSDDGNILSWSLASRIDRVHSGIPAWAARAILTAAFQYALSHGLSSGMLLFNGGAHGEVGSSSYIFGVLVKSLIDIVALEVDAIDATMLYSIIGTHCGK